jgi:hypothetical protein
MIKLLMISTVFMILLSCSSTSKELDSFFESNQIDELNRLTNFIIDELSSDCNYEQVKCLTSYFDQYKEPGYDFQLTGISKERQNELLNSLSESTYNNIWTTCIGQKSISKDSIVNIESICPNMNGKFADFLVNYCSKHERLTDYGYAFQQAGDYSPAMNSQLFKQPTVFDFESEAELVLISIHLITLNREDRIIESETNHR